MNNESLMVEVVQKSTVAETYTLLIKGCKHNSIMSEGPNVACGFDLMADNVFTTQCYDLKAKHGKVISL